MALLLGCFAPVAVAANYSYPATYKGTTTAGGTVEFSVSADGTSSGASEQPTVTSSRPRVVVSYRQEGGIGGPRRPSSSPEAAGQE